MKIKEFFKHYMRIVNNRVILGPMPENQSYCLKCFNEQDEIVPTFYDSKKQVYICEKEHEMPCESLPPSGTAHTGIR